MRDDDELLTTDELADVRKMPASRLAKERLGNGGPPFMKDHNLVRYRWGDWREWLAQQTRYTTTKEADDA